MINIVTPSLCLTSFYEACGQNCPPEIKGTAEAGGFKETSALAGWYNYSFHHVVNYKRKAFHPLTKGPDFHTSMKKIALFNSF